MEPLRGIRVGAHRRSEWEINHPERKPEPGRICRHRGCGTILSIYNHQNYCSVHAKSDYVPKDSRFRDA